MQPFTYLQDGVSAEGERSGLLKASDKSSKTNSRDCADPLKETG